jgi:hypothetical protein
MTFKLCPALFLFLNGFRMLFYWYSGFKEFSGFRLLGGQVIPLTCSGFVHMRSAVIFHATFGAPLGPPGNTTTAQPWTAKNTGSY